MCLLALISRERPVTKREYWNAARSNQDGFGVAYVVKGNLQVKKTTNMQEGWKILRTAQQHKTRTGPVLAHWRLGTHGADDESNVHPFLICKGAVALAHNGVLPCERHDELSDTRIWAETVFWGRSERQLLSEGFLRRVEEHCGASKFVLLRRDGDFAIVNEAMGHWQKGTWFSNHGYQKSVVSYRFVRPANTSTYLDDSDDWSVVPHRQYIGGGRIYTSWEDLPAEAFCYDGGIPKYYRLGDELAMEIEPNGPKTSRYYSNKEIAGFCAGLATESLDKGKENE